MPFRRFRRFKRRRFTTNRSIAKKAVGTYKRKRLRKFVNKQIMRMDPVKYHFNEVSNAALPNAATITPMIFWPPRGTAQYVNIENLALGQAERIGNTLRIRSLQFKYAVSFGDQENFARITVIQWMDNDLSNPPTIGDVYQNTPGSIPWLAHFNPYTKQKYKILYDKCHTLADVGGTQAIITRNIPLHFKLRKKLLRIDQDGQFGLSPIVYSGNIYIILSSDSTVIPNPSITYTIRLGWNDN